MKGSALKLSDVLIAAVFLLSILSVLKYDAINVLITMVFCFWIIGLYTIENDTPYLLAKLEKCPSCSSKSTRFFSWSDIVEKFKEFKGFVVRPEIHWDIFTGNFKIKCEKCKKIYPANIKIRIFYSFLHFSGIVLPIIIYFFYLIPFIGINNVDPAKVPVLFIPLIMIFIVHAYFRIKYKT